MKKVEQLTEEIIDLRRKVQEEYKENYKLKQVIVADRNSDSHARQMTIISHHKHKHDIDMGNKPRQVIHNCYQQRVVIHNCCHRYKHHFILC